MRELRVCMVRYEFNSLVAETDLLVKIGIKPVIGSGHAFQGKGVLGESKPDKQAYPLNQFILLSTHRRLHRVLGDSLEAVSPTPQSLQATFPLQKENDYQFQDKRKKPCTMQTDLEWRGCE